ncbi:hypothetical protein GC170_14510 [bacterium]|nr:hypothetical protein [bacterium]
MIRNALTLAALAGALFVVTCLLMLKGKPKWKQSFTSPHSQHALAEPAKPRHRCRKRCGLCRS